MKKKLNFKLCKSIIQTDFFLVNQNVLNNKQKINKRLNLGRRNLLSLDILRLSKEIKQFIRVLYFTSLKLNSKIIFYLKNPQFFIFLRDYANKYKLPIMVSKKISASKTVNESVFKRAPRKLLLSLESLHTLNHEKSLSFNKFLLIVNISFENRMIKGSSLYKIYNKLDNHKKICFLLSILETFFLKKK